MCFVQTIITASIMRSTSWEQVNIWSTLTKSAECSSAGDNNVIIQDTTLGHITLMGACKLESQYCLRLMVIQLDLVCIHWVLATSLQTRQNLPEPRHKLIRCIGKTYLTHFDASSSFTVIHFSYIGGDIYVWSEFTLDLGEWKNKVHSFLAIVE